MTVKRWAGILIGASVALVVPLSFLAVAKLMEVGIMLIVRESSTMQSLTSIALTEAFLGPIGIVIVGRSARIRGALAWLGYLVVVVPVLAFAWFVCVATLSGALGSPF